MTSRSPGTLFGRLQSGRVDLRNADGRPAHSTTARSARLVVCRSDCKVICFEMHRKALLRIRSTVERELPRAYPGSLAGVVYDMVVQRVPKKLVVLVVLMREEHLARYETTAGGAGLVLAAQLLASARRAQRGKGSAPERILIRDGPTNELASLWRGAVVDSFLLPPGTGALDGSVEEVDLTGQPASDPPAREAAASDRGNTRAAHGASPAALFDHHRGVRRWMVSALLSPLFVSLALPILVAGNLAVTSLIMQRADVVDELRAQVACSSAAAARSADVTRRSQEIAAELDRLAAMRPRGTYPLLCELWRALSGTATLREFAFEHGTAEMELVSPDPVETLRLIAASPSVASVELIASGRARPDARFAITVRAVYK